MNATERQAKVLEQPRAESLLGRRQLLQGTVALTLASHWHAGKNHQPVEPSITYAALGSADCSGEFDQLCTSAGVVGLGSRGAALIEHLCARPLSTGLDWRNESYHHTSRVPLLFLVGEPLGIASNSRAWEILNGATGSGVVVVNLLGGGRSRGFAESSTPVLPRTWAGELQRQGRLVWDLMSMLDEQGHVAVDFEDLRIILAGADRGLDVFVGTACGVKRDELAVRRAAAGNGNHVPWAGAHRVAVIVAHGHRGCRLSESKAIMNCVRSSAAPDGHVIYGTCRDTSLMTDAIRVTVMTTS
jgi:hypothetical protein